MGLKIDTNNLIVQAKSEQQTAIRSDGDNSISIFNFDNLKEHTEELTVAGGITAIGLVSLSIIGKKNLFYLLNKSIKFKNLEQAKEFGKTKILKALNQKKPYEQMIIIDKNTNTIVAQVKGKKDYVHTNAFNVIKQSGSFSVEHGHPTSCFINGKPASAPLSFDDYRSSLWGHGAEDVIAYDVNGKFSMLSRKPNFKKLNSKEIEYYEKLYFEIYDDVYLKKMLKHLPKEFKFITSGKELGEIYNTLKRNGKWTKELDNKFKKAFQELEKEDPEYFYKVDKFWKTHADDLGVVYKSNYEYLKPQSTDEFSDFIDSFDLDMLFKLCHNLSGENKKIIAEAFMKKDFETIKKICNQSIKFSTTTSTLNDKITREDFIKYMSDKLANVDKIDVNTLIDSEIRNLARLFKISEEQVRHMDKKEFRRLCIQIHPDRNPNDCMANQKFIILNKIFQD